MPTPTDPTPTLDAPHNRLMLRRGREDDRARVRLDTLSRMAEQHAVALWGSDVSAGEPLPVNDPQGRVVQYAFPFALDGQDVADRDALVARLDLLWTAEEGDRTRRRHPPAELPTLILQEVERYGTIYLSARRDDLPVPRVTHGLHPFFYNARRALKPFGKSAVLEGLFLDAPHEYFEIRAPEGRVLLHTHLLLRPDEIAEMAKPFARPGAVDALGPQPEPPDAPSVTRAWQAYLDPAAFPIDPLLSPPAGAPYRIRRWERMPPILWSRWCEPTAASMVISFWDHYVPVPGIGTHVGYDRIVDYWLDHPTSGHNVPDILDPIADGPNIDVTNVQKGYQWSVTKTIGNAGNDYAWSEIVQGLQANRPLVWHLFSGSFAHATAVYGYRIFNGQRYLLLYTTWGPVPEEWLYNSYGGVALTHVEVDRYEPGGREQNRYLFIRRPYGNETLRVGEFSEILYAVHPESDIRIARIEASMDGGQNWDLVVETWTQPGWNRWYWQPTSTTTRGRVRIRGLSESRAHLAGDGSYTNFSIA